MHKAFIFSKLKKKIVFNSFISNIICNSVSTKNIKKLCFCPSEVNTENFLVRSKFLVPTEKKLLGYLLAFVYRAFNKFVVDTFEMLGIFCI